MTTIDEAPSMKLHPRYAKVSKARHIIGEAIARAIGEHDITFGELLAALAEEQRAWAGHLMQDERTPEESPNAAD